MKRKNLKKVKKLIKKEKYRKARKLLKAVLEEKTDSDVLLFLEEREKNIHRLDDEDMYLSQLEVISIALELGIDKEMYLNWRDARYGSTTIEKTNNPVWEWLVRTRASGYISRLVWGLGDEYPEYPGWSFLRFGQSKTVLPDGRIVYIAGEHEDYYDADFFIYNDVIVIHPDERIDIYTYPKDTFPPTDFHSATLVGEWIVIIGRLGYDRSLQDTPVYKLNINDFSIQRVQTFGVSPNRLHEHVAVLSQDRTDIRLLGGCVYSSSDRTRIKNIDDWELNIENWNWVCRNQSPWFRWTFKREDGCRITLSQARWKLENHIKKKGNILEDNPRRFALSRLYKPPCSFQTIESEELDVYRICIDGVVIRYDEESHHIAMTIEGTLSPDLTEILIQDLVHKLFLIEGEIFQAEQV